MNLKSKCNPAITLKLSVFLFLFCCCNPLKMLAQDKPNVVFILVDDLGYGDLGCYGATKLKTPNIDKLASEGKVFTDAHSASAVCTPSRYALLTGQYPYLANNGKGIWGPLPVTSGLIIDTNSLTLPDVFKQKGYTTAAIGKWHLGFKTGTNDWQEPLRPGPQDLGFDYYFGLPVVSSAPPYVWVENDHIVGGDPSDPLVYLGKNNAEATPITEIPVEAGNRTPNRFKGAVEAHKRFNPYAMGEVLTKKAVDWIKANKENPFFLYLATPLIHHPFTPAKRFQGSSQSGLYGDYIQELDWMVGEVTKSLEDNGLSDNTLVVFASDNGGMFNVNAQDAYNISGHRQNGDLLGFKFGVWEGGQRIPFIAKWPGKIKAGTQSHQLICLVDMLASFAALTGQNYSKIALANSVNVLPALLGEPKSPLRDELVLAPRNASNFSLRKGKWMYIPARGSGGFGGSKPGTHGFSGPPAATYTHHPNSDIENGKIKADAPPAQLYDLEKDVNQTTNLYNQYPEIVKKMEAILEIYMPKE